MDTNKVLWTRKRHASISAFFDRVRQKTDNCSSLSELSTQVRQLTCTASMRLIFSIFFLFLAGAASELSSDPKCPPGTLAQLDGTQKTCFLFVNLVKTFWDAETHCQQQNGHLAVLSDVFTDMYLSSQAHEILGQATVFWIGGKVEAYTSFNVWTWTNHDSLMKYTNWKDPAASGTTPVPGYCTSVTIDNGYWYAVRCNETRPFVCEVPGMVSNCDPGYSYFDQTNMCYKRVVDRVNMHTFDQADNNCSAEGGHLASIHSAAENMFVSSLDPEELVNGDYTTYTLIGGKSNSNKVYSWTDGTPFDYSNWYDNATYSGACTGLLSYGIAPGEQYKMEWNTAWGCTTPLGKFFCKKTLSNVPYYVN